MPEEPERILVTGASRGLGQAIARRLASPGRHIIVGYARRKTGAEETAAHVRERGATAEILHLRLDKPDTIPAAMRSLGPIATLVNNAGLTNDGHFAMQSPQQFDEVLEVGLQGAIRVAREVVRSMMSQGRGTIVNVSSVVTRRGQPGRVAYTTAKGGLEAFTRALAIEVAPRGVRVNAVVAGAIEAGMTLAAPRSAVEGWAAQIPLARLGEASDIADAVAFLVSDASKYIVGHALVVDGGLSL